MEKHQNTLLSPYSDRDFFNNYFEKAHLHISRNVPGYFDSWLTLEDIDEYLAYQELSFPSVNLVKNSNSSPIPEWMIRPELREGIKLNREQVLRHFSNGYTLILNYLERYVPKLSKNLNDQSDLWGVELSSNIYITPPQAQGFDWHYDDHDVLVLQVSGSKSWFIIPEEPFLPDSNYKSAFPPTKNSENSIEILLQPGDTLYVPRGIYHKAISTEETSVHITLGIQTFKVYEMLKTLVNSAIQQREFRASVLPKVKDSDSLNSIIESLEQHFKKQFDTIKHTPSKLVRNRSQSSDQSFSGRFINAIKLSALSPSSVLISRHKEVKWSEDGLFIYLKFGQKHLKFPIVLKRTLEILLSGKKVNYSELDSNIESAHIHQLVKKLVTEGWLDIVA